MATRLSHVLDSLLPALRYEPTAKRIRARLAGVPVTDSTRAVLLWEPRRVVPAYAVPEDDVVARLAPAADALPDASPVGAVADAPATGAGTTAAAGPLFPSVPFAVHSCAGTALDVSAGGRVAVGAAFRLEDPDLAGLVVLDPAAFDWFEEDEPVIGHPRDPFTRIDVRRGSQRVRVSAGGVLLADSRAPRLLFETHLPTRYYLPAADVRWDRLVRTASSSICPYKGTAAYWALRDGDADVAWAYPEPLPDAVQIAGMACFYDDRVQVEIDGG